MSKKAYMTPDMEIVKLNYQTSLLSMSDGGNSGADNPKPWDPNDDD